MKFFITMAAFFGIIFAVITPPFQTPDEGFHFYRAYQISEFNFIPDPHPGSLLGGGYMPSSLGETVALRSNPDIRYNPNGKYDWHRTFKAFAIKTKSDTKFYDTSSAIFTPVMYVPQSVAILMGRIINVPPILMMYMARFAALVTYIVLFAFVIKLMPRKKWAVAAIGLVPMGLFQAVALGGDALTIGTSSLLLAYILYLRDKDVRLTTRQLTIIFLIASACVLSRGITILFLPLILLLPGKLFKSRPYLVKALLIVVPLFLFFAWMFMIRGDNIQTIALTKGAPDTVGQMQFITHKPLSYVNVLWETHFFYFRSTDIVVSFIGSFGYMDTPLSGWIVVVGYIGLAVLLLAKTSPRFDDKPMPWLNAREKALILLLLFLYWLAVNTNMYAACSNVGSKLICGVQGRYFLPLLLPLLPVLYYSWLRIKPYAYKRIAVGLSLFLLVTSVVTIWYRYYVHMF